MPGAFKPPAPQAPVRYRCVQDLSEASLGSLLLCVAPQLWLAASSSRYKTSCPGRRQLADLLDNLHCLSEARRFQYRKAAEVPARRRGVVGTDAKPPPGERRMAVKFAKLPELLQNRQTGRLERRLPQRATRHMLGSRRSTDRVARQIAKLFEGVASAEHSRGNAAA
jgi:hypothetical protein